MHISVNGLHLIEGFEGWSSCPYWDSYGGVWTRGYGETEGVGPNSSCISQSFGERNLRYRLERFYEWAISDIRGLNQNQWDALCSFIWNLGPGVVARGSSLGGLLRSGQFHAFADRMLEYDHAGGVVLAGLRTRREMERRLFLSNAPPSNPETYLTPPERRAVEGFDRLRHQPLKHPIQWRKVRAEIKYLRQSIWYAAERGIIRTRPPKHTERGWHVFHRAERYNILRSRVR